MTVEAETCTTTATRSKKRSALFLVGGVVVALLLAGIVSNFASSSPDGLESVVRDGCTFNANEEITSGQCAAQQAQGHDLSTSPLADYGVSGVDNSFLSTGLSGVIGVLLTLAIGFGLFALLRNKKSSGDASVDGG